MHTGLTKYVKYCYVVTSVDEEDLDSGVTSVVLWAVAGTGET